MEQKANPYAGDYVVYVYEFTDNHAYVGLTVRVETRKKQHEDRGSVFEHLKVCRNVSFKILEFNIQNPLKAIESEKKWIEEYRRRNWKMLNISRGGSLGSLSLRHSWTKEAVIEEAQKFRCKKDWSIGSRASYNTAKQNRWFEEATSEMIRPPTWNKGISWSAKHRRKLSRIHSGKTLSEGHRANIGLSLLGRKRGPYKMQRI
jgi:predicted GIY-YIG superfamily endonuclease